MKRIRCAPRDGCGEAIGGISIDAEGKVSVFQKSDPTGMEAVVDCLQIEDADFVAVFQDGAWTISWKWMDGAGFPESTNQIPEYRVASHKRDEYEREVDEWIHSGWLRSF
jgi:hypothetical protein